VTEPGRFATLPLHLGGFIGPFGGAVLAVLVPELRDAFGATTSQIALAVPAYLVPFALLQVVSGTFGERFGRRRTVQGAYLAYAVASVATALAPTIGVFLAGRALQGAANAFTTPLVMAALADIVPRERLGRTIGTFAGVQAAGVSFAPLLGGLAAAVSWRLAFFAPAAVSMGLMLMPPKDPVATAAETPSLRALLNRRMARLTAAACAGYLGLTGLPFLVSIRIDDAFDLASSPRGLILAAYGAAGFVLGNVAGRLVERVGGRRGAVIGAIVGAAFVALIGIADSPLLLALVWTAGGAASALLWAGLNTIAVGSSETNRAGVVSAYQASKFVGAAAAPVVWLPLYHASAPLVFGCAALVTLAVIPFTPHDDGGSRSAIALTDVELGGGPASTSA
jgi:MFS family permease